MANALLLMLHLASIAMARRNSAEIGDEQLGRSAV